MHTFLQNNSNAKRHYVGWISSILMICLAASISASAQIFELSTRDALKLKNRKLIVVLQEENQELVNRFRKDPEKLARYRALLTYTNKTLQKTANYFWKTSDSILYKTAKECVELAQNSEAYFTLEYSSFRAQENTQLYLLKPDTSKVYGLRKELIRRKETGFFELKFIEKFRGQAFYTFTTPSSVPNELDFATATNTIYQLVKLKTGNPKFTSRDYELKIQQANASLAYRTLLVDSNEVNKQGKSYQYIRKEYDSLSLYELQDPKGIVEKLYRTDTTYCYLTIVPYVDPIARGQSYMGTSGGNINDYERKVYFMQLIFDIATGECIYYDKSEENVVIVRDWRRFQRYSRESSFVLPFQKASSEENITEPPPQKKIYQNQQNQY